MESFQKKKTAAERGKKWRNPENEELAKERKEKNRKRMSLFLLVHTVMRRLVAFGHSSCT